MKKSRKIKKSGKTAKQKFKLKPCSKNFFVVQEHKAKRAGLHYDIRLTYISPKLKKCMLLSFASRKLPKLVSGKLNKIQVFPTEDHSLDYANFEGEIPYGYGAGTVKIWDKGNIKYVEFTPDKIKVIFSGKKLKGCYTFITVKRKNKKISDDIYDKNKTWLLIKTNDEKCK